MKKYYVLGAIFIAAFLALVAYGLETDCPDTAGYDELDRGTGNYSTAIIELEDGTVKSVPVECIKFVVDEPPEIFPKTYAGLYKLTIRS